MNAKSVVVYNLYSQYFNTDNEACSTDQSWAFPQLFFSPLPLNVDRRKKFNTLVVNINDAIKAVLDDVTKNSNVKYKISAADWDPWTHDGVSGQYCDPASTGHYPDPKQPDLQFFKPNTFVSPTYHDELKKRYQVDGNVSKPEQATDRVSDLYSSLLWKSPNRPAEALHNLNPRAAPAPPGCPGDGDNGISSSLGTPDAFGKFFHPNELGHETISAFALETMIQTRADVLGLANPSCAAAIDDFKCFQKDGRKTYADAGRLNTNYKIFCDQVRPPANTVGWNSEVSYDQNTPDEHSFLLQLSSKASRFDKDECYHSFDRIINGCDGNDPQNPLDWKFGGRYVKGEYIYELNVKRDNRPWPPIQKPYGACEGWYKALYSAYSVHGAGWSSWDGGQQTLLPSIKGCLGLGVTAFTFQYFDKPDDKGMEWVASFNTPIWVRARCFANNKVVRASGGFTDGCSGND